MTIQDFFEEHKEVAVACSGGVDSIYLLYLATKYARKVTAYFVKSPFQPQFELTDAKAACEQLKVEIKVLYVDVLEDAQIRKNDKNRCYDCKNHIFKTIWKAARDDGMECLLDGTNASDDASDRPGMKALKELQVFSPLRLCGYTKAEIRRQAKIAGLAVHDKPSYACLATRIPTGMPITGERLEKIERAENILMELGFTDFRVRMYENAARIQLREEQLPMILTHRTVIQEKLSELFEAVMLDLQTR